MSYFIRIAEVNKSLIKPSDCDIIYYSELKEFHSPNAFRSLSVKYVLDQAINYKSGANSFQVHKGQYMIACKQPGANVYFESQQQVKSICIDICPASFAEIYAVVSDRQSDFEKYLADYFKPPEFFENVNPISDDGIGKLLKALAQSIHEGKTVAVSKEWFLNLAEQIVYKEFGNYLSLKDIRFERASTKKEIFRRLQLGKTFIDTCFLDIREIKEVANQSLMSEYHFFRCFRQAFKTTPFQYLTTKRLEFARRLLKTTPQSVTEIASICNYPDAYTFSKAFKRQYGFAPTHFRKLTGSGSA